MKRVCVVLALLLAGGLGFSRAIPRSDRAAQESAPAHALPVPALPVTVLCVRHAEKDAAGGADPGLSESGRKRARALADALRSAHVSRLYASTLRRTRETLEPLARQLGL